MEIEPIKQANLMRSLGLKCEVTSLYTQASFFAAQHFTKEQKEKLPSKVRESINHLAAAAAH